LPLTAASFARRHQPLSHKQKTLTLSVKVRCEQQAHVVSRGELDFAHVLKMENV
jgi:hypothetical protein